ncbi:hypothetical protein GGI06_000922, partial [Coemansia sp. S85]
LVSIPGKAIATCNSWPRRLADIDHPTSHQAKELDITLDVRDIYLSKSLQQLSNAPYEGCAFPMACIIRFRLTVDDKPGQTYEVHPPDIAANIAAFAQRIREVAPRVSEVHVDNDDKLQNLPMFQDAHFADLIRQLFGIVKTTVISAVWRLFRDLDGSNLSATHLIGDDVFFRGNAATLEYLRLELHTYTVEVLKQYRVFTPTSHPKLQCVKLDRQSDYLGGVFDTTDAYLRFVMDMAPNASVRVIPNLSWPEAEVSSTLLILGDYKGIQILSMADATLSIWSAMSLIQSLPLLSDLHTLAPTLGELPPSVQKGELASYVHTTYAPMGRRLRCWQMSGSCNYEEVATCMFLLALACPNFDYAAVDNKQREKLMEAMRVKIDEPELSDDAPRLRRLLFNGWQG